MNSKRVLGLALGLGAAAWAAGPVKHVRLLHMADSHAQLETHWEYTPEKSGQLVRMGGYARIKTLLDRLREGAPGAVFTADGGDTFQGSAIAAWTQGKAVLEPLNALGIDVGVPGNWEVVYGPGAFRSLMSSVAYKVVAYNFHDQATGERLFDPATVLVRDGVKVAFVGVTDPTTTTRQPPATVKGLDSTRMEGLRAFVQELKAREKPDLMVLVDHTGLAISVRLAAEIPEFDVVLSGHTHERTYRPIRVGRTLVVEPASMGSFIGQLDLTLQDGKVQASEFHLVPVDAGIPEDPKVKAMILKSEAPFRARLDAVEGHTSRRIMRYDVLESTMDNAVADAVHEAAGTDIAFTNGFRFSPPQHRGSITEGDLWNWLPLDSPIKTGKVTGRRLLDYLEQEMELVYAKDPMALSGGWGTRPSGLRIRFKAKAAKGKRIEKVWVGKDLLDLKKTYTLAGCEREGEPMDVICRLKGASEVQYLRKMEVHEALRAYLAKHDPLALKNDGRVIATDLPRKVWSQYAMLQKLWNLPGQASATKLPKR